jgi:hypothetical protein
MNGWIFLWQLGTRTGAQLAVGRLSNLRHGGYRRGGTGDDSLVMNQPIDGADSTAARSGFISQAEPDRVASN